MKQDVRETVRKGYAAIAVGGGSCCGPSKGCCGSGDAADVARAVGYSDAELATLPEGANMGLSCGNAVAGEDLPAHAGVVPWERCHAFGGKDGR